MSFNSSNNSDLGKVIAKWNDLCSTKDIRIPANSWVYFKSGNVMVYMCNNYRFNSGALPCQGHGIEAILREIDRGCGTQRIGGWVEWNRWNWNWLHMSYYSIGRDPFTYTDGNRIQECGLGNDGIDADTCDVDGVGHMTCPT